MPEQTLVALPGPAVEVVGGGNHEARVRRGDIVDGDQRSATDEHTFEPLPHPGCVTSPHGRVTDQPGGLVLGIPAAGTDHDTAPLGGRFDQ